MTDDVGGWNKLELMNEVTSRVRDILEKEPTWDIEEFFFEDSNRLYIMTLGGTIEINISQG